MKTLREKIDRGLEIIAQIEKLAEEYKALEEQIKAAALERPAEHVKLEDPEREGRQFLAAGTDVVVPVVMTADSIMQTIKKGSALELRLAAMAREWLTDVQAYCRAWAYEHADGRVDLWTGTKRDLAQHLHDR